MTSDGPTRRDGRDDKSASSRDLSSHQTLRELGNLRQANQRLVVSALAAQESQATSDELQKRLAKFVSMIAHELRNPLAPLRTCADLLQSGRLGSPELAKVHAILSRQIHHLTRIVDDLLEGARVNEGKLRLQCRVFEFPSVVDAAVESCAASMATRDQQLERRGPDGATSLLVDGDPVRLVQVFGNLLDNASKYTPRGGKIVLAMSATVEEIRVVVSDDGIGIAEDVLPKVFEPFTQDPRALEVHSGGLGIGLAVVREMVLAHGGTVTARSGGHGLGSAFEVVLPRARPVAADPVSGPGAG